ncbi:MAG: phosphodiester glycosidase family protein [Acidimicrobiales bacterium]
MRRREWFVIPALILAFVMWSVFGALTTVGNEGFSAKWADWLRSHHAAFLANDLERAYYNMHAPKKGGAPKALNALPKTSPTAAPASNPLRANTAQGPTSTTTQGPVHLPAPSPVPLLVSPALPGEGQWQPVGPLVNGVSGMYEAQFRADDVYTSEITSAVWIDPTLMDVSLIPGQSEPGGTWTHPPYVTPTELPTIAAAFNGGFRFADAQGGFYLDGVTAVPLVAGAASMVIYSNGKIDIGAWGTEVTMTPEVVAVLQNLVPMVDNGVVAAAATYNDTSVWGATLGASTVVARSGIGVTAQGALVYVAGPALTARTLAEALQRAGAVRAMTLDINPEWVTFNFFSHLDPTNPSTITSASLYPDMGRPATRYLGPADESRDFFEVAAPVG